MNEPKLSAEKRLVLDSLGAVVAEKRMVVERLGMMNTCLDEVERMRQSMAFAQALAEFHTAQDALSAALAKPPL